MSALIPRPVRRLQAARVAGATLLSVLGLRIFAGGHPETFVGSTDQWASVVNVFALTAGVLATIVVAGLLAGRRWATIATPLLLSLYVGTFVPVLAIEVQIGGSVVLWNILLIGDLLFGFTTRNPRARRDQPGAALAWLQRYGPATQHLLFVALLAGLAVFGFERRDALVFDSIVLAFSLATLAMVAPYAFELVRERRRYLVAFAVVMALALPSALTSVPTLLALVWALQALLLAVLVARGPVFADLLQSFYNRPALLILSTFGLLAFAGALVLSFPSAAADGHSMPFIDALFTATSATCVTGLLVLDTPSALTTFGHATLLALIQLGGLGIMVLSTFAAVLLGGRLALRGEQALEEVLDLTSPGSAYALTRFIVFSTLAIEAIAAVVLTLSFHYNYDYALAESMWRGVFHAVSAFCNAGFSLWSDSLIQFKQDALIQGVIGCLVTIGGLGFPVLLALWLRARGSERRLPLQARVVLWMSLALVIGGALLFAVCEWDASLRGLPVVDKLVNSLFQSVQFRTAGFNTVDFTAIERSTIVVALVWMFIGASPGSTGGGIKTTTLAVVLAAIPALIRNQPRALVLGRTIPHDIVYRAATIMTIATLIAVVVTFALLASHDIAFEKAAFEAISALTTAGITIGATPQLNALGKWLIIVTMFVGRVGPLSLALALGAPRSAHVAFPEAKIMVG